MKNPAYLLIQQDKLKDSRLFSGAEHKIAAKTKRPYYLVSAPIQTRINMPEFEVLEQHVSVYDAWHPSERRGQTLCHLTINFAQHDDCPLAKLYFYFSISGELLGLVPIATEAANAKQRTLSAGERSGLEKYGSVAAQPYLSQILASYQKKQQSVSAEHMKLLNAVSVHAEKQSRVSNKKRKAAATRGLIVALTESIQWIQDNIMFLSRHDAKALSIFEEMSAHYSNQLTELTAAMVISDKIAEWDTPAGFVQPIQENAPSSKLRLLAVRKALDQLAKQPVKAKQLVDKHRLLEEKYDLLSNNQADEILDTMLAINEVCQICYLEFQNFLVKKDSELEGELLKDYMKLLRFPPYMAMHELVRQSDLCRLKIVIDCCTDFYKDNSLIWGLTLLHRLFLDNVFDNKPLQDDAFAMLEYLLEIGCNPDIREPFKGNAVIHQAAYIVDHRAMAALIVAGADLNLQQKKEDYKIICRDKIVISFFKSKAVKAPCAEFTPIQVAALKGSLELVGRLLKAGANVNIRSKNGFTALGVYLYRKHGFFTREIRMENIQQLLDAGAEINELQLAFTDMAATPAFIACQEGDLKVIALLHEMGSDFNFLRGDGIAPLVIAVQNQHITTVDYLLNTVKVDLRFNDCLILLRIATQRQTRNHDIFKLLYEAYVEQGVTIKFESGDFNITRTPEASLSDVGLDASSKLDFNR